MPAYSLPAPLPFPDFPADRGASFPKYRANTITGWVWVLALLCSAGLLGGAQEPGTEGITTVTPRDTGVALVNPDMGWTMHFYSNVPSNYGSRLEPSDTLEDFPGLSTVYLRLPWALLEPEEGRYNWAMLDTPAQRWIAKGGKIALRLTCSENWMTHATPRWVQDAGARGTHYQYGKGRVESGGSWDPFFDDAVFLAKLGAFLAACAKRYDGNPNVAFVDVGTYGLWGEGHTHASSQQDDFAVKKLHIDLHRRHFKNTLLCLSDDFAGHDARGDHFPITDYALEQGLTLRDDSILVQPPPRAWYHHGMAQAFWPRRPVILEHEHYGNAVRRKSWDGARLLKAVDDYHASFLSIHGWPRELLRENRAVIDAINLRLGYRLMPISVSWPESVPIASRQEAYTTYGSGPAGGARDRDFRVTWSWTNQGVAPCYPGGHPALTLKDAKGGIVSVLVDESLNLGDLKVGPPGQAPVTRHESAFIVGLHAPTTRPGTYDLYVSAGARDGTPTLALPLADGDGQRRYKLGRITLVAPEEKAPVTGAASR